MENHYSILRAGRENRTLCGLLVPAGNATAAQPISCPECRAKLRAKSQRETATAEALPAGQEKQFHQAVAKSFAGYAA